jgi:hypothetical protein
LIIGIVTAGCIGVKTPPISRPPAPALFIDYYRTGGIAGLNDRLVIFDNGVTVVSTKTSSKEMVLNTSDIDRITNIFTQAQFSILQENYPAPHEGADLIKYSINYHGKTVTTEESAIPPSLLPVIDELNSYIKTAT